MKARKFRVVRYGGPDNIVLGCSLKSDDDHVALSAVASIFQTAIVASFVQLAFGAHGTLPVRGGIDIGLGTFVKKDNFVVSPGLMRAYNLENEVATYPRVVVGDRPIQLLQSVARRPITSEDERVEQIAADSLLRFLFQDKDSVWMLDFFGPEAKRAMGFEPDAKNMAARAWNFAVDSERQAREAGNYHVAAKYAWLLDYMASRLKHWTT